MKASKRLKNSKLEFDQNFTDFQLVHNWIEDNKEVKTALFENVSVKTESNRYDEYIAIYKKYNEFKCKKCSTEATHYKLIRDNETYPYSFQLYVNASMISVQRTIDVNKDKIKEYTNDSNYDDNACLLCEKCITQYQKEFINKAKQK